MSIKVTLGEAKTQQEKPFPKLMIDGYERVVLATGRTNEDEQHEVVYIKGFSNELLGKVCDDFGLFNPMNPFEDYTGSITLQND